MSRDRRKALVRSDYGRLGVARQCELVGISRSTHYYTAKGENELNLGLMRRIDGQYLKTPWYGSRQMARQLRRDGLAVGDGGCADGPWKGPFVYTDVTDSETATIPLKFILSQNYPNPFNPVTTIEYSVPDRALITISVFNVLGQSVRSLVHEIKSAGTYRAEWDGVDDAGSPVSTGVYLYRFQAGDVVQTKKMVLLK